MGQTEANANFVQSNGSGFKMRLVSFLKKETLLIAVLASVFVGLILGISINSLTQSMQEPNKTMMLNLLGFPGELLIRMLRMLVLPLVVCSLIAGLAGLEKQASGKVGRRTVAWYLSTTLLASILGLIIVVIIQPGKNVSVKTNLSLEKSDAKALDSFLDLLRNMFPDNIVQACFEQAKASNKVIKIPIRSVFINMSATSTKELEKIKAMYDVKEEVFNGTSGVNRTYYTVFKNVTVSGPVEYRSGQNLIGLVVFALAVGIVAASLGEDGKPLLKFVDALNKVISKLILYVMWYSPFAMWSLLAVAFAQMEDINETFESLGLFIVSAVLGLAILMLCVYPGLYYLFVRKNPYSFMKGLLQPMITAFGTSSSAATLPITMKCLEEKLKVDSRIVDFMVPIGVTVNMDGTAMYVSLVAIYVAQAYNYSLGFGQYIAIRRFHEIARKFSLKNGLPDLDISTNGQLKWASGLSGTLASIGASGIPAVVPIALLIVLETAGLPLESFGMIISIHWLLDRIQTSVNVCGDCFGAAVVAHLSRNELLDFEGQGTTTVNFRNDEKDISLLPGDSVEEPVNTKL